MLWSSGMKLVAFPDPRPAPVLLAAMGLTALLLICNTHTRTLYTTPTQSLSNYKATSHGKRFLMHPLTGGETRHMFRAGHVQPESMTNDAHKEMSEMQDAFFLESETELFLMTKARLLKLL